MFTRVTIENYRCFESYKVDGLAQVNLFVGKNNSGKTALLEGMQFLASAGDPAVLAEITERRGELVFGRDDPRMYRGRIASADIAHLFFGHTLAPDTAVQISGDNGCGPVKIIVDNIGEKSRRSKALPATTNGPGLILRIEGTTSSDEDSYFPISRDGGVDFEDPRRPRRPGAPRRTQERQVRFVGTDSLDSIELAYMWDEITVQGHETDVTEAMRVIEPELQSVHFLTGMLSSGYFPSRGGIVVGMKNQDTRVPLGSMGDGMRRLLALAASLAFTTEGSLFVDEIDTGLHYSVMPDMWKLVVSKAVASNTQVFATTHSWDCIQGLSLLCQREPDFSSKVSVHKIDRQIPHSIAFSGESLVGMVESDIDPR